MSSGDSPQQTFCASFVKGLLGLADRYKALTGCADSGVSRAVFGNDQHFVKRLRNLENITLEKAWRFEMTLRRLIAELEADAASGGKPPARVAAPSAPAGEQNV